MSPVCDRVRGGGRAGDDLAVELGGLEQLVVVSLGDDAAVVEHHDLVGEFDRREAVRDHEGGATGHRLGQRVLDALLGGRVDRRGGVVEHQHARVGHERSRDRQTLALPARERHAALADLRLISLRQPRDELVRLRVTRGLFDLGQRRVRTRVGDVFGDARREQEGVVADDRNGGAHRAHRHLAHVGAVEQHLAGDRVIQP